MDIDLSVYQLVEVPEAEIGGGVGFGMTCVNVLKKGGREGCRGRVCRLSKCEQIIYLS